MGVANEQITLIFMVSSGINATAKEYIVSVSKVLSPAAEVDWNVDDDSDEGRFTAVEKHQCFSVLGCFGFLNVFKNAFLPTPQTNPVAAAPTIVTFATVQQQPFTH
jgi:hypothetical protein